MKSAADAVDRFMPDDRSPISLDYIYVQMAKKQHNKTKTTQSLHDLEGVLWELTKELAGNLRQFLSKWRAPKDKLGWGTTHPYGRLKIANGNLCQVSLKYSHSPQP